MQMIPVLVLGISEDGQNFTWQSSVPFEKLPNFALAAALVQLQGKVAAVLKPPADTGPKVEPANAQLLEMLKKRNGQ